MQLAIHRRRKRKKERRANHHGQAGKETRQIDFLARTQLHHKTPRGLANVTFVKPTANAALICERKPGVLTCCTLPSASAMFPCKTCSVLSQAASIDEPMNLFQLGSNPPSPPVTLRSPNIIVSGRSSVERIPTKKLTF